MSPWQWFRIIFGACLAAGLLTVAVLVMLKYVAGVDL